MNFDLANAEAVEEYIDKAGVTRRRYIFSCVKNCGAQIKIYPNMAGKHNGNCRRCAYASDQEYGTLFKRIKRAAIRAGRDFELSYVELVELTKQSTCHYCGTAIYWATNADINSKRQAGFSSNLDRKHCNIGYRKDNVVPCCWECNCAKSNLFAYDEFLMIVEFLKEVRGDDIWAGRQRRER